MQAIKEARKFIENHPQSPDAAILSQLVLSLESQAAFAITDIYKLDYDHFKLALEVLQDWRLDRYYASKVRLFDVSLQLAAMQKTGELKTTEPQTADPKASAKAAPSKADAPAKAAE